MPRAHRVTPDQDRLKEVMHYDPDTGIFTRKIDRRKWKAGQEMGTPSADGYVNIGLDYKIYRAHRLAWVYMTGEQPTTGIDHVNGIRNDNRWSNLRLADQSSNLCNKVVQSNNKLGVKGVYMMKTGRFRSSVNIRGSGVYLGEFKTAEEAKAAYDAAAKIAHKEFFRA